MDKKNLRDDLFLIFSLLLVASVSIIVTINHRDRHNLLASISVKNEVVEVIDLDRVGEKDFYVDGLNGRLHIHTHDGAIAVLESNCPHQDCVKMGYVKEGGHPIICAYNAVTINIKGATPNDVDVG